MNTLLLLAVFLVVSLTVQATVLWLAARVCRLPKCGRGQAVAISAVRLLVLVGLWVALVGRDGDSTMMPVFGVVTLVADTVVTVWLVRRLFGGRLRAVVGAWALHAI